MASTIQIAAPEHPINSVTVFKSSKAEIVRTFSLNLKSGQNKIEIRGLPSTIDTHSVRVSGLGDARLFDVVCTIGKNKDLSSSSDNYDEGIRALKVKRMTFESQKRIREQEADLLGAYAKTLSGEHVTPTQMAQFLQSFVEQGDRNLDAVSVLSEKILEIDRQIERETNKMAAKKGYSHGEVIVVIGTDGSCAVELKLTYIVSNVHWHPTYELHATTEGGKPSSSVSLHYRALVTQSTGEDWTNTALTLSTVSSDTVAKNIPDLVPVKIIPGNAFRKAQAYSNNVSSMRGGGFGAAQAPQAASSTFGVPQQQHQDGHAFGSFGAFGGGGHVSYATDAVDDYTYEEVALPGPISEPTTVVTETPIAISYSVHGESTIPTDGIEHQVSIAVLPFEAKISYVSIPRIEPRVYLQCQVKNSSEYRLLPGPVSVILDDSYVSKTSINDVNTGDTFDCTLGDDAATKVTYSRTSRTVKAGGGAFAEVMNTTTYTTRISIHNKHQFAIPDLIVRDLIPTSNDKHVKVILRKPEGLANAKDGEVVDIKNDGLKVMWEKLVDGKGGEKEGKFEWSWKIANGAKVTLEAEWEVKAPADVTWSETTSSLFG